MRLGFDGKVVLVTGASGGIGAAVAEAFADSGATLAVHYNEGAEGAAAVVKHAEAAGARAIAVQADLALVGCADRVVAEVVSALGGVDVLVNNAGGMVMRSSIAAADDELFDRIVDLNFRAVFAMCRAVIPVMQRRGGGSIVNVSSSAARNGGAGRSVLYASAKGAVSTFSRGLAAELAGDNIRVNVVAPGLIDTPFHDGLTSPEQLRRIEGTIPMGRIGRPDECALPVLFLASDVAASYITGHSLEVNGGRIMP